MHAAQVSEAVIIALGSELLTPERIDTQLALRDAPAQRAWRSGSSTQAASPRSKNDPEYTGIFRDNRDADSQACQPRAGIGRQDWAVPRPLIRGSPCARGCSLECPPRTSTMSSRDDRPHSGRRLVLGAVRLSRHSSREPCDRPNTTRKTGVNPERSRSASTLVTGWRRGQSPANPSRTSANEHKANVERIPTHAHDSPLHTPGH